MKTLVLIHGFLGSPLDWEKLKSYLTPELEVLTVTLPGHDGEKLFSDNSLRAISQNLLRQLPDKFHLMGYSLGGRVAMAMNEASPTRLCSLTLVASAPGPRTEKEILLRKEFDSQWKNEFGKTGFLDKWYDQAIFGDLTPSEKNFLTERRKLQNWSLLQTVFEQTSQAANPHFWNSLKQTNGLYIAGSKDEKYVQIGSQILAENPSFHIETIENAGHALPITHPKRLAELWQKHWSTT